MSDTHTASLPYHEPDIQTILILVSFIILLNLINHALDKILYCGLLGQVFLGIAWGTPGGKLLSLGAEELIVNLGYLGLLLIVYEGGLLTSFKSLKANLLLSVGVAVTGIAVPIGLSFCLQLLLGATALQAFAAGAALCSTSLGTTFTLLSSSGLVATRLGVVLTSAAMMDDVVGLIMVQVISNLGSSTSSFSAATVVRPVFVSFGFAVFVVIAARYVVLPLTIRLNAKRSQHREAYLNRSLTHQYGGLVVHTTILVGLVTAASYAGTSNLFAAYLAGASVSWWDSDVPHLSVQASEAGSKRSQEQTRELARSEGGDTAVGDGAHRLPTTDAAEKIARSTEQGCEAFFNATLATSGRAVFDEFYSQPLQRILKPFFFASVGFSVPISKMFRSAILWRGLIYTILMCIGKLVCGLWLSRIPGLPQKLPNLIRARKEESVKGSAHQEQETSDRAKNRDGSKDDDPICAAGGLATPPPEPELTSAPDPKTSTVVKVKKPLSLYPAAIIGLAMVARGEIGFLISALAESNGLFVQSSKGEQRPESSDESDIFMVVTWAIMLCTIIGPVGVGWLVRRLKRLEKKREGSGAERNVLGVWGVQ